ncbi:type II toxin-antitoxin system Phd/YefM family antitoxin [Jiangella gansuensis]|uniref:type II toxin-antitoxin system Phd/YefM family antitoxin n=1 Tax=Jiangella gansuensis TaxID=281473 RepID=UPI00047B53EA|nr:prevent-host-death protein [Jiangella gansuensis]
MKTVNIHDAKTHLSRLVHEEFIIAKAGKPVARVIPITEPPQNRRLGFLRSVPPVPDDFDDMFAEQIEAGFTGSET